MADPCSCTRTLEEVRAMPPDERAAYGRSMSMTRMVHGACKLCFDGWPIASLPRISVEEPCE